MEQNSDNDEPLSTKQVEKLQALWKSMKESKRTAQLNIHQNLETLKQNESTLKSTLLNDQLEKAIQENKMVSHDKQLIKIKENNILLTNKINDKDEELEKCHEKIAKLVNLNNIQSEQITEMNKKLEAYANQQKNLVEASKMNTNLIEQDLDIKEKEIEELKQVIEDLQNKIEHLSKNNKDYYDENANLSYQLQLKSSENERIQQKLVQVEESLDDLYMEKASKGNELLEIESLKSDIDRLIQLLKQTKEFKEFSMFAEDKFDIRFLKHIQLKYQAALRQDIAKVKKGCSCSKESEINEKFFWVPKDASKLLNEFITRNNGRLTPENSEELLFGLHKLFLSHEETTINKLKRNYESEVQKLRREVDKHTSYDQVHAKKKIMKLKDEIERKQSQQNLSTNLSYFTQYDPITSKSPLKSQKPSKVITIDDAVKVASQYEIEIRQKEELILQQKQKIQELEQENHQYEKIVYIEGALWILKKIQKENLKFKQEAASAQNDYLQNLDAFGSSDQCSEYDKQLLQNFREFLDESNRQLDKYLGKVDSMRVATEQQFIKLTGSKQIQDDNDPSLMNLSFPQSQIGSAKKSNM